MTKWWHLAVEEIARILGTDGKSGLSEAAAGEKLRRKAGVPWPSFSTSSKA
jgi:hypothetical protein